MDENSGNSELIFLLILLRCALGDESIVWPVAGGGGGGIRDARTRRSFFIHMYVFVCVFSVEVSCVAAVVLSM